MEKDRKHKNIQKDDLDQQNIQQLALASVGNPLLELSILLYTTASDTTCRAVHFAELE